MVVYVQRCVNDSMIGFDWLLCFECEHRSCSFVAAVELDSPLSLRALRPTLDQNHDQYKSKLCVSSDRARLAPSLRLHRFLCGVLRIIEAALSSAAVAAIADTRSVALALLAVVFAISAVVFTFSAVVVTFPAAVFAFSAVVARSVASNDVAAAVHRPVVASTPAVALRGIRSLAGLLRLLWVEQVASLPSLSAEDASLAEGRQGACLPSCDERIPSLAVVT